MMKNHHRWQRYYLNENQSRYFMMGKEAKMFQHDRNFTTIGKAQPQ
jgi:hypothetical protein